MYYHLMLFQEKMDSNRAKNRYEYPWIHNVQWYLGILSMHFCHRTVKMPSSCHISPRFLCLMFGIRSLLVFHWMYISRILLLTSEFGGYFRRQVWNKIVPNLLSNIIKQYIATRFKHLIQILSRFNRRWKRVYSQLELTYFFYALCHVYSGTIDR